MWLISMVRESPILHDLLPTLRMHPLRPSTGTLTQRPTASELGNDRPQPPAPLACALLSSSGAAAGAVFLIF